MNTQNTEQEQSVKDPVCGMEISRTATSEEFVYQDKAYIFCSGSCREKFEAEPDKYVNTQSA